jgi:hypothetical protein
VPTREGARVRDVVAGARTTPHVLRFYGQAETIRDACGSETSRSVAMAR